MVQYSCAGDYLNNQWTSIPVDDSFGSWKLLRNRNSGMCLNVSGASSLNGVKLSQYSCDPGHNNERVWIH